MNKLIVMLSAASLLFISGCSVFNPGGSSDFSCPGMPAGVVCKTPRQVYNHTDSDTGKKKSSKANVAPQYIFASLPGKNGNVNPTPVLEQAKIMRVWIAPWVDENKDLHWPGIMFTQIQPRMWHFGSERFNGVEPPVPHRAFTPDTKELPKGDDSKTPAAGSDQAQTDQPVPTNTLN